MAQGVQASPMVFRVQPSILRGFDLGHKDYIKMSNCQFVLNLTSNPLAQSSLTALLNELTKTYALQYGEGLTAVRVKAIWVRYGGEEAAKTYLDDNNIRDVLYLVAKGSPDAYLNTLFEDTKWGTAMGVVATESSIPGDGSGPGCGCECHR